MKVYVIHHEDSIIVVSEDNFEQTMADYFHPKNGRERDDADIMTYDLDDHAVHIEISNRCRINRY